LTSRVIDLRPWPADVPRSETAFRPNGANQLQVSAMNDPQCLADRYVAVWNETDPDRRRRAIAELWRPDGRHYVDTREACGYDALEKRITGSHEKNVRDGGHRFRAGPNARALRDVVAFQWEMVLADGERVVAGGLVFLMLDREGRILVDYLFVLPNAAAA